MVFFAMVDLSLDVEARLVYRLPYSIIRYADNMLLLVSFSSVAVIKLSLGDARYSEFN